MNIKVTDLADDKYEYEQVKKILSLSKQLDPLIESKDLEKWDQSRVEEICNKINESETPAMKMFDTDMVELQQLSLSVKIEDLLFAFPNKLYEEDTKLRFKSPIWSQLFHEYYQYNMERNLECVGAVDVEHFVRDYLDNTDFPPIEKEFLKAYKVVKYDLVYPLSILAYYF